MPVSRRQLLKAGATAGALLLARPVPGLAATLSPSAEFSTSRSSRLFPGTHLVHADLHNHTLLSDGDGDAANAFASMRTAGLDVAAITDHSGADKLTPQAPCSGDHCTGVVGINEASWQRLGALADAADTPASFVAIRGFEWSSPLLGHVNVWFSQTWTDPGATAGAGGEGAGQHLRQVPAVGAVAAGLLDSTYRAARPAGGMQLFYDWLNAEPQRPLLGGGLDGIAGFNHPGREAGRFGYFGLAQAARDRIVSIEVFNRRADYLYEGTDEGQPSPINECLNAGWRVGLLGVTDEHGTDWGYPDGKGRTGLWVSDATREGVKEAMLARRFFSTRLRGLRLDAAATSGATTARMGGVLAHGSGPVTFRLDIDRGPQWWGKPLSVQVLRPGTVMPDVIDAVDVVVPRDDEPVIELTVGLDAADGEWIVLRVTDPEEAPDDRADDTYRVFGNAVAYASPFFLDPGA
jgi:hypothetical protein